MPSNTPRRITVAAALMGPIALNFFGTHRYPSLTNGLIVPRLSLHDTAVGLCSVDHRLPHAAISQGHKKSCID